MMDRGDRLLLLEGPKVCISVGMKVVIPEVTLRALSAVSKTAHKHFTKRPNYYELNLPFGSVDKKALEHVIHWLKDVCSTANTYVIPHGRTFTQNVLIYKVCRVLGINSNIGHILNAIRDEITTRLLEYKEIHAIVTNLTPSDPVFIHLAHNLTHKRYLKEIPDSECFQAYLSEHPELEKLMAEIHAKNTARYRRLKAKEAADAREEEWLEWRRTAKWRPESVSASDVEPKTPASNIGVVRSIPEGIA